jgi:hypothetical protein
MKWEPILESELLEELNNSFNRMNDKQKKLWDIIKISPEKWRQEPYGNEGNGFWVIAIFDNTVIWYNDIEEGFNQSAYSKYGQIDEYGCDQNQLEWVLQHILEKKQN